MKNQSKGGMINNLAVAIGLLLSVSILACSNGNASTDAPIAASQSSVCDSTENWKEGVLMGKGVPPNKVGLVVGEYCRDGQEIRFKESEEDSEAKATFVAGVVSDLLDLLADTPVPETTSTALPSQVSPEDGTLPPPTVSIIPVSLDDYASLVCSRDNEAKLEQLKMVEPPASLHGFHRGLLSVAEDVENATGHPEERLMRDIMSGRFYIGSMMSNPGEVSLWHFKAEAWEINNDPQKQEIQKAFLSAGCSF